MVILATVLKIPNYCDHENCWLVLVRFRISGESGVFERYVYHLDC